MRRIKVSIIVSCYNTDEYVAECIESIVSQTCLDIEIILINDGSTDNSLEIMRRYEASDDRIIIINQDNHGLGYSRNLGIDKSQGEYILFVDSDDFLEKDTIEGLYFNANSLDLDLLYYSGKIVNDAKDEKYDSFNPYKRHTEFETQVFSGIDYFISEYPDVITSSCMVLIKKDFILNNNIRFRSKYFHEDVAFNFCMMMDAERVSVCDKEYYCRRLRPGSIMRSSKTIDHALGVSYAALDILNKIDSNANEIFFKYAFDFVSQSINIFLDLCTDENEKNIYRDCILKIISFYEDWGRTDVCLKDINAVIGSLGNLIDVSVLLKDDIKGLEDIRDDLYEEIFRCIKLGDYTQTVGIYGIGKKTKRLLDEYDRVIGKPNAEVFFIVTEPSEVEIYMDKEVLCIDDISRKNPDEIIITSEIYGDEMIAEIEKRYGKQYNTKKVFI